MLLKYDNCSIDQKSQDNGLLEGTEKLSHPKNSAVFVNKSLYKRD